MRLPGWRTQSWASPAVRSSRWQSPGTFRETVLPGPASRAGSDSRAAVPLGRHWASRSRATRWGRRQDCKDGSPSSGTVGLQSRDRLGLGLGAMDHLAVIAEKDDLAPVPIEQSRRWDRPAGEIRIESLRIGRRGNLGETAWIDRSDAAWFFQSCLAGGLAYSSR